MSREERSDRSHIMTNPSWQGRTRQNHSDERSRGRPTIYLFTAEADARLDWEGRPMSTMTPTTDLARMLIRARARTDALFGLLRPEAFYQRPVPERHRLIFYLGHLEAFDRNLLSQGAAAQSSPSELDQLFAFGIDPRPGELPQDKPSDWPKVAQVHQYNVRVRRDVDDLLNGTFDQWLSVALEH